MHLDVAAAGDAAFAHASCYYGSVGGHASAHGEYALGGLHAFNVVRGGLEPYEYDLGLLVLFRVNPEKKENINIAVLLFVIIMSLTVFQLKMQKKWVNYD